MKKTYWPWIGYLTLFAGFALLTPRFSHRDMTLWKHWAGHIQHAGLAKVYETKSDYPPLLHFVLFLYTWFIGSSVIYWLKLWMLVLDFAAAWLVFRFVGKWYAPLVFLLNPAVWYNTLIWGQVDGFLALLAFAAFVLAWKGQVAAVGAVFVAMINLKLQGVIFLPLLALLVLPTMVRTFSWKNLLLWLLAPAAVQVLLLMPFILEGNLHEVWKVANTAVGRYPVISANAYNLWEFVEKGNLYYLRDDMLFLGLTYRLWGFILFFSTSFIALWPLLRATWSEIFHRKVHPRKLEFALLAAILCSLLFFYVNTQMHERYSHPALIFAAVYALTYRRWTGYIVLSAAVLLNMEDVLKSLHLPNYSTFIFDNELISVLYLFAILWHFVKSSRFRYSG